MAWSASPEEVRVEHTADALASIGGSFVAFYAAVALVSLPLVLLLAPSMILAWGAFVVAAGVVAWQARPTRIAPYSFVLTPDEARLTWTGEGAHVRRADATRVVAETRPAGRGATTYAVEVHGTGGRVLLSTSLGSPEELTLVEAAFEEWRWPVGR
ncbi:MAG: hypothetical protein AB7L84_00815 [Acidimicrobiia bacterium]